jgi:hypothetical protein
MKLQNVYRHYGTLGHITTYGTTETVEGGKRTILQPPPLLTPPLAAPGHTCPAKNMLGVLTTTP